MERADILIVGAGGAGLALALALRRLSGERLDVLVCDPALAARRPGPRSTALARGPVNFLDRLGVWPALEGRAQPICRMEIDERRPGEPDAASLVFGDAGTAAPLGHMVFLHDLETALHEACVACGVRMLAEEIQTATPDRSGVVVASRAGAWRARLVVGADGGRSRVAQAMGAVVREWSYDRAALVVTVAHQRPHEGVAVQTFLEDGPFAALPMTGGRTSVVWTRRPQAARELAADSAALTAALAEMLSPRLGEIALADTPATFPLGFRVADRFVGPRMALVGDAAHRVHPLAGQGLNLGLRDVAVLAEHVLADAVDGLDFGAAETLGRYAAARKFDVLASGLAFDLLHRVFSAPLAPLRRAGMLATNRSAALKRLLETEAAGLSGSAPALFR